MSPVSDLSLPTAPKSRSDALNWLRLIRSPRVGATTFLRLLREHGDAAAALAALPGIARAAGVAHYAACPMERAEQEYQAGRQGGARLICLGMAQYPPLLARIPAPPPILWAKGQLEMLARPMVALVGARNASSLGMRMARALAADLGTGGIIVASGLARGIDTAAHEAALDTGTIAVLAGGINKVYPPENQALARHIAANGVLVSEQPPELAPQARLFPRRNRIISGLCQATIVVEGAAKSGSLITAREALDQGREVMAVPGHPMDARASGCNMLIRDGATLVRNASDIMALLQPQDPPPDPAPTPPPRSTEPPKASIPRALDLSRRILSLLSPAPIPEDQLIRELNVPAQSVSPHLVELELAGKLERQSGGVLSLTPQPP